MSAHNNFENMSTTTKDISSELTKEYAYRDTIMFDPIIINMIQLFDEKREVELFMSTILNIYNDNNIELISDSVSKCIDEVKKDDIFHNEKKQILDKYIPAFKKELFSVLESSSLKLDFSKKREMRSFVIRILESDLSVEIKIEKINSYFSDCEKKISDGKFFEIDTPDKLKKIFDENYVLITRTQEYKKVISDIMSLNNIKNIKKIEEEIIGKFSLIQKESIFILTSFMHAFYKGCADYEQTVMDIINNTKWSNKIKYDQLIYAHI